MNTTQPPAPTPDVSLAQTVVDAYTSKGLDCTIDDVFFARALVSFVEGYTQHDKSAINPATKRLANASDPLGMTAAVLLARLQRQFPEAATDEECVALVGTCVLQVLVSLSPGARPKWGR